MNTTQDDGGPAFPGKHQENVGIPDLAPKMILIEHGGMTLRDWFAGMALQGFISSYPRGDCADAHLIAPDCYEVADAMLAARKEKR